MRLRNAPPEPVATRIRRFGVTAITQIQSTALHLADWATYIVVGRDAMGNSPADPIAWRRLFQFRLQSILIVMTLICIYLSAAAQTSSYLGVACKLTFGVYLVAPGIAALAGILRREAVNRIVMSAVMCLIVWSAIELGNFDVSLRNLTNLTPFVWIPQIILLFATRPLLGADRPCQRTNGPLLETFVVVCTACVICGIAFAYLFQERVYWKQTGGTVISVTGIGNMTRFEYGYEAGHDTHRYRGTGVLSPLQNPLSERRWRQLRSRRPGDTIAVYFMASDPSVDVLFPDREPHEILIPLVGFALTAMFYLALEAAVAAMAKSRSPHYFSRQDTNINSTAS